ncbi:MAG: 50S ribosome-binding GTPase, partial [Deltaproteobacteria bacterium]|nr:50S ribosome-binding GTPase [Deltaproteobacteria bacterium]
STNRTPREFTEGTPGQELLVELELKLMADVGLVGFPNAGKSTLISSISKARPKVADYPFTTLAPHLGVVYADDYDSFVVADIPGIIEGAHEGAGLGHRFLRHIERTAFLLLLVDCTSESDEVLRQYRVLLKELSLHQAALMEKPRAVALTKTDASPGEAHLRSLVAALEKQGESVFAISAVARKGLEPLLRHLSKKVKARREQERASQMPAQKGSPERLIPLREHPVPEPSDKPPEAQKSKAKQSGAKQPVAKQPAAQTTRARPVAARAGAGKGKKVAAKRVAAKQSATKKSVAKPRGAQTTRARPVAARAGAGKGKKFAAKRVAAKQSATKKSVAKPRAAQTTRAKPVAARAGAGKGKKIAAKRVAAKQSTTKKSVAKPRGAQTTRAKPSAVKKRVGGRGPA